MSMKVYRLLRNNKEEGPFSAEELILKNLRPFDLIWVDGSSAAWRYPDEIPQFRQYAPLPVEEKALKQEISKNQPVSASVQAAMAVTNNISPGIKEKPRYKVSAAWSRIQTVSDPVLKHDQPPVVKKAPKRNMVNGSSNNISSKSLSWEEAWLDWETEKKSVKSISTVQQPAYFNNKTSAPALKKEAPVLETKYQQPLDVLEDKYIENVLLQKQRSKRSFSAGKAGSFILPFIALIIIFGAAFWLLNDTEMPSISSSPAKPPVAAATPNSTEVTAPVTEENNNQEKTAPQKQAGHQNEATDMAGQAKERKKTYVQPAVHTVLKQTNKPVTETPFVTEPKQDIGRLVNDINRTQPLLNKKPANNSTPVEDNSTEASGNTNTAEAAKPETSTKKLIADYIKLPSYIEMNNGIANIKIENVSDVSLDLVVVDVQYFNDVNSFRKGETFYLHNLRAGRDVTIKTSKDVASAYATSKISLISSDAKQLYIVGDN